MSHIDAIGVANNQLRCSTALLIGVIMQLIVRAMTWAFALGLASAPFGLAGPLVGVVLLAVFALSYLITYMLDVQLSFFNYTPREFAALWVLTAGFWYPMYLAGSFTYMLTTAGVKELLV